MDFLSLTPWIIALSVYFAAFFGQLSQSPRPDAPRGGFVLSRPLTSGLGIAVALGFMFGIPGSRLFFALSALLSLVALALPSLIQGSRQVTVDGLRTTVPAHARAWTLTQGLASAVLLLVFVRMLVDYSAVPLPGR